VKLARMRGADLVTEPSREDQDDRYGDHVHELCNHEHGIADHERMTEKDRCRQGPQRVGALADSGGAVLSGAVEKRR
jgi:hypothetical protein